MASADILRKFDDMIEVILPQLPTTFDSIVDAEGKAALIWILGEYGEVRIYSVTLCTYTCICRCMVTVCVLLAYFVQGWSNQLYVVQILVYVTAGCFFLRQPSGCSSIFAESKG